MATKAKKYSLIFISSLFSLICCSFGIIFILKDAKIESNIKKKISLNQKHSSQNTFAMNTIYESKTGLYRISLDGEKWKPRRKREGIDMEFELNEWNHTSGASIALIAFEPGSNTKPELGKKELMEKLKEFAIINFKENYILENEIEAKENEDFKFLNETYITLNGQPALQMDITAKMNGIDVTFHNYYCEVNKENDKGILVIWTLTPNEFFQKMLPDLKELIKGIQFIIS